MSAAFWLGLSGLLVSVSGLYYAILVYTRKAPSNPVSWAAWSIIGIAMFLTSNSEFGFNAITFGMINPIVITAIAVWRQLQTAEPLTRREMASAIIGFGAIIAWLFAQIHKAPSEWILGLSILADCIPLWAILRGAWEKPADDKPFPWVIFAIGFGLSAFGQSELSVYTLALPVYMFVGASAVAFPLVVYRIQKRTPLHQWV